VAARTVTYFPFIFTYSWPLRMYTHLGPREVRTFLDVRRYPVALFLVAPPDK